jgi:EmrB/QacA subfamily drug resistance transporter
VLFSCTNGIFVSPPHEPPLDYQVTAREPLNPLPTPLPSEVGGLFFSLFPSIMLPMFLAVSDQTIVASALPAIAANLGDVERVSLVVVGYLVAATIAAPVYGYLGDVFGRRRLMFFGLAIFILASLACALAPSILWLSFFRVVQGLGGGGLMAMSQALVGEVVPSRQRGHFQGYLATVAMSSAAFGPVVGGFLTDHFGWRSIFYMTVPVGLLAVLLMLRLQARRGIRDDSWSFDSLGLTYFILFITPALLALEQARHLQWSSVSIILILLGLSTLSFILLVRHEQNCSSPLLPLSLFRQRAIWEANCMSMCHGAALTGLIAFLPIYLRIVRGLSASNVGMILLPISIGIGIGSMITGRIISRTGQTMIIPSIGLIISTLLLALFVFIGPDLSTAHLTILLTCTALFMGTVMTVVQVTVQTIAGRKSLGAAAGSVQFSRTVGAAFGTALFGTILFAVIAVQDDHAVHLLGLILDQGADALNNLDHVTRSAFEQHITFAFRCAFTLLPCITCIGAILAWTNPARRI